MAPPADSDDDGGGGGGGGGDDGPGPGPGPGGGGGGGGGGGDDDDDKTVIKQIITADWGDLTLPQWLKNLRSVSEFLTEFGKAPLKFLRRRIIPVILGGVFGIASTVADSIFLPFQAAAGSITFLAGRLTQPVEIVRGLLLNLLDIVTQFVATATAPLGPLQPFATVGLLLLAMYVVGRLLARALNAGVSAIPFVGPAVQTLLSG